MATPALQPMCCWFVHDNTSEHDNSSHETTMTIADWHTVVISYDTLCIIASILSILGATYQLLPRKPEMTPRSDKERQSFYIQNRIVCWLAFVDLLASLGILVRSCIWISGSLPWLKHIHGRRANDFSHLSCAVLSAWIQFFYICTYFWTLTYAVHQYRAVHGRYSAMWMYHCVSWGLPSICSVTALLALYLPSFYSCEITEWKLQIAYFTSCLPIVIVMIVNPILYYLISERVDSSIRSQGLYTDLQRQYMKNLRSKFLSVILVFYVCWSPNLLNGILLLWIGRVDLGVYLALWHYMAVVNPLQAFLNSIVYHNVGGCRFNWTKSIKHSIHPWKKDKYRPVNQDLSHTDYEGSNEESPLLSYR